MRIHSFVAPEALREEIVTLSSAESHHLARVLRVEAGQELTLFDGQGTRAEGAVNSVSKKEVTVRITSRELIAPPAVEITLIQAVCKPDRFEMILQKATELGVRTIQPVITQNASLPGGKIEKMINRSEAIIRNAAQQCGTAWLPVFQGLEKIAAIFPLLGKSNVDPCRAGTVENLPAENHLASNPAGRPSAIPALQKNDAFDAVFIGSLHPNAKPFKEALRNISEAGETLRSVESFQPAIRTAGVPPAEESTAGVSPALRVALLIGPEGDFTEEEVSAAVEAGATPVTFGKQILRTETAAIFGLSVLAYELF
jgi:16S rRNA (uracil1498-N3)-methyltransferase